MIHATTTTTKLDHDNPWPGLESYEEDAQDYFFGRELKIEELLNKVLDAPVTVFYGRSGLGKTSLLQAGLFPLLREHDFLPIYVRFEIGPGSAPLARQLHDSVRDSIQRASLLDPMLPSDEESLWEYLHRNDFELWSSKNYPLTPVIVLDQFEELFTLGEKLPDRVDAFRNDLGDLAENRIPADLAARIKNADLVASQFNLRSRNYKLLISLREDYLPHLDEWCRLIPALGRSRMRLIPLREDEALDAVRKPAADLMTDELARRIVDIIAGVDIHPGRDTAPSGVDHPGDQRKVSGVDPALLSLFCRELNEVRKRNGQSHFDKQLVEEAKDTTLADYYSSCIRDLEPSVAKFIETQLISEKGFRNFYPLEDAVPSRLTDEDLAHLVDSRLLRVVDHYGAQRIELTHDVLTRAVREHRDRRRAEEDRQRAKALEKAAAQREAELDRERQARRRLRKLTVALAAVCAAAVVLALVAVSYGRSATAARNEADARSDEALAERLSARGQLMLLTAQPGSELEAFNKLLAAQTILDKEGSGGLLTALITRPALQKVIGLPTKGSLLSADGQRVITSDEAGVQVLEGGTGKPRGKPFADAASGVLAVSWDGRFVAIGDAQGIRVWDADGGTPVGPPLVGSDPPVWVAVSPDGHRVAAVVATEENELQVRLWQARAGLQTFSGRLATGSDFVSALAFSRSGTILATGSWNGAVTVWDAKTGTRLRDMNSDGNDSADGHEGGGQQAKTTSVNSLAFSPDGQTIAAGAREGGAWRLRTWDTLSGERLVNSGVASPGNTSVAFSSDGTRVVAGSTDGNVDVRDAATGEAIGGALFFIEPVTQVAQTLRGDQIITVSDRSLEISDARAHATFAAEVGGSRAAGLAGSDDRYGLYETSEGPRIAVVGENDLHWLDTDTGAQIGPTVVSETIRDVVQMDISRDQKWLAIGGSDADIDILDASSAQPHGDPLEGHTEALTDVAFSPDGKTLASVSDDKTVRLWDWTRGSSIADPAPAHRWAPESVVFSEDGQRLYTRSPDSIRIWDNKLNPIGTPITGKNITALALSPDGSRIAAVDSKHNDIQEYDAKTGEKIGDPLEGHSKWVDDLDYSSDGQYLVSMGRDAKLRFWDVRSGTQIGMPVPMEAVGDTVYVALSDDDRRVFVTAERDPSGSHGGGIWEIPGPSAWADILCSKLVADPTEEQWEDLIDPDADYRELCRG